MVHLLCCFPAKHSFRWIDKPLLFIWLFFSIILPLFLCGLIWILECYNNTFYKSGVLAPLPIGEPVLWLESGVCVYIFSSLITLLRLSDSSFSLWGDNLYLSLREGLSANLKLLLTLVDARRDPGDPSSFLLPLALRSSNFHGDMIDTGDIIDLSTGASLCVDILS